MVSSMTAFARISQESNFGRFTWEIRSVNSRYLEPIIRLPDTLRDLEPALRELLNQHLSRGKVECSLRFQAQQADARFNVNENLVHQLVQAADQVQAIIGPGQAIDVLEVLQWPGVLSHEEADSKKLKDAVLDTFKQALEQAQLARAREGQELAKLILQRMQQMKPLVAQVQQEMPAALVLQQQQLHQRLGELKEQLDPNRLEAEMLILAQKADVAEELDRLNTHIQEVERILKQNEPIGRRLDFMMQELNREANTLSSKALTTTITNAAVELKVLIEQAREQIQNIE